MEIQIKRPIVLILIGIPTSGKSFFANNQKDYIVLSRDICRINLFGVNYKQNSNDEKQVNMLFNCLFQQCLKEERNIIIDNCNVKISYIEDLKKKIPQNYIIKYKIFPIPLWKAHLRNIIRYFKDDKWISLEVVNNMYVNYNKLKKNYGKSLDL